MHVLSRAHAKMGNFNCPFHPTTNQNLFREHESRRNMCELFKIYLWTHISKQTPGDLATNQIWIRFYFTVHINKAYTNVQMQYHVLFECGEPFTEHMNLTETLWTFQTLVVKWYIEVATKFGASFIAKFVKHKCAKDTEMQWHALLNPI